MGVFKRKKFKEDLTQNLIKMAFFLLAAVLIVQSFPREGRFRYSFQEGKPWRYDLMTAPYDFQIYKTDNQIQVERDSALKSFKSYMRMDTSLVTSMNRKLQLLISTHPEMKQGEISYVTDKIRRIYESGVVSSVTFDQLMQDSMLSVMLLRGNVASEYDTKRLLTVKKAYAFFFEDPPFFVNTQRIKGLQLNQVIQENVQLDAQANSQAKSELENRISITSGMIQRGERIIDRGEIISPEVFQILHSLKRVAEERSASYGKSGVLMGQIVLVLGLFVLQFLYMWFFRPIMYERKANVAFLLILITGLVLLTSLIVGKGRMNVYMIPYAILPIMVRTFFDSRTALFAHIITVLISSTIVAYPYEFLLIQIAAGMTSVYSLRDLTQRSQLVMCAILVVLTYCVMFFGVSLIQEGFMNRINASMFLNFVINGGLMLTSYLLIYFFEWLFGYTSNVTLMELSNMNNSLLRAFSETAPGSFQHSLQVSNLATAAAQEINANVQLARTGAMYHDIGKMVNPMYFTENQLGVNPHDELSPEESCKMITSHVDEGLKLANKFGLPLVIRDCIRMHHGNGPVRFFYNNFKKSNPDAEVPEVYFYRGVNPNTKETAILMMADAVEASSRSLKDFSEKSISDLVDKIINAKIQDGAFKNIPLTFRDLERVKMVFKLKLQSIYHSRIAYPEIKENGN